MLLGGDWLACRGQASTCLYSEEVRRISASVHGDDVTVKASWEDAEWLIRKFKEGVRDQDADDRRSRGSRQAAPDPQQNGAMEFPTALDRSRLM